MPENNSGVSARRPLGPSKHLIQTIWIFLLVLAWVGSAMAAGTITVCPSGCDYSTLQGAVNAASDGDIIQLLTTSPHTEFDIVVNKSVTIDGLGETTTIVQAAGSPGTAPNRVFFILSGKTVTIKDMTIRYGDTNSQGGGLYNQGGDVMLVDVRIHDNEASHGGGVYSAGGTLTITDAWIFNNTIIGDGGGVYNAGTLIMTNSDITSNKNLGRGAGIYNSGFASIQHSNISFNDVLLTSGFDLKGGGIYSEGILKVTGATVSNNDMAGATSPSSFIGGGGIYFSGTDFEIANSTVSHNDVGNDMDGGGIFIHGGDTTISHSSIENNRATGGFSSTGGLYASSGTLTIQDTTIRDNMGDAGGGLHIGSVSLNLLTSTINDNHSDYGGGLYLCNQGTEVDLANVTISGNEAQRDGGGIYVCSLGEVSLANATLTANIADEDDDGNGNGGGIYLQTFNTNSGIANLKNTIVQGNIDFTNFPGVASPDCHGAVTSGGYNLIGTLGFWLGQNQPCSVTGTANGNQVGGVDAMLAPLADNGGLTETHALTSGSPAINAGNPASCLDYDNKPLLKDQRGGLRTNRCDIGAYERGALVEHLFVPLLNKR